MVALWDSLGTMPRRAAFIAWGLLVGTKVSPGLLQAILMTRRLGLVSWRRFVHIQHGRVAGLRTVLSSGRTGPAAGTAARPGNPVVPG